MPTPSPAPSTIPAADMPALPPGWVWTTIGNIADTTSGGTPSRSHIEYYGGSIPWVKSGELNDDLISETEEQISELGLRNSSAKVFSKGTVLVALYGATVGRTGILHIDAATNQAICALFPLKESFDAKYMMYWLRSERQSLINLSVGGAQLNISQGVIRAFHFPLPPLAEQRRIVAAIETQLTRLDAGVASLKAAKAKLKRYRASVLKAACEGRLVAQDVNDEPADVLLRRILGDRGQRIGKRRATELAAPDTTGLPELPTGWCWVSIQALIIDGPQNGLYLPRSAYGEGTPILRIDDFQDGTSRSSEELRRVRASEDEQRIYGLQKNDLIINRVNSPSHLGKSLLVEERNTPAIFESNMMRLRLTILVDPTYVETYLRSVDGRRRLISNAKWAVNQASINQTDVGQTIIPLPPLAEQRRIVAEVERLLSVVTALEATVTANLKRAERLRQSILKRAFEGKLVAQDEG